jgi:hypothetical protein
MNRLFALVVSTMVAGLVGWSPTVRAQTGATRPVPDGQGRGSVSALSGSIEGRVVDERGVPLTGAMVFALGATTAAAVTDQRGVFALRALPAGSYWVRAHMSGFAPSRRQLVDVSAAGPARYSVTLQRTAALPVAPGQPPPPPPPPKLIAAALAPVDLGFDPLGFDPSRNRDDPADPSADRTEKAWRIRHLPRSVLKTTTERAAKAPEGSDVTASPASARPRSASTIARAMGAPARRLGDLPLSGQVNLMTSGSFDGVPGAWASDSAVRGTAYFTVAGPAWGYGDWSARVMTQSNLGSWFMSGAFRNRAPSRHLYSVGFSYSTQRVAPGVAFAPLGLDRAELAGRAAGTLYGVGQLAISPRLTIDYGARYSRYDYLSGAGLFSPRVMVTLVPVKGFRVKAGAARHLLAPGAEEFMEPLTSVLWVPPERTFIGYSPMVPERTLRYEVALEHDLTPALMLSVKSSYQNTTDQQIAFFGVPSTGERQRHYGIGDAGDVVARSWSVGVTHHLLPRLQGSVAYEVTDARWLPAEPGPDLLLVGYRPRPASERLRDLATSIETVLPVTATQVYVAYRLNTGFARFAGGDDAGLDSRFDVQVTQRLPSFGLSSAQWQVLLAVKNLFRDASRGGSVYDELFVVRPPTRILGGVMVRF